MQTPPPGRASAAQRRCRGSRSLQRAPAASLPGPAQRLPRLQDLADVPVDGRAPPALGVLARDHLGHETQEQELHADRDEERPERQEWSMPDRAAGELDARQVDADRGADPADEQPRAAEQVERAMPIAGEEEHGQQVEQAADAPLEPVSRAPVDARPVVHGHFRDAEAAVVREHRQVAMQLAVDVQVLDDLAAVDLEPAVHVVEPHAGHEPRHPVEDPRQRAARPRIAPTGLPARYEVVALLELREQARDLCRVVLEVGIHRHDGVAAGMRESGCERRGFAEVAPEAYDPDRVALRAQSGQLGERAVCRPVVDEDDLPGAAERLECGADLREERSEARLLVVDGHDDREPDAAGGRDGLEGANGCGLHQRTRRFVVATRNPVFVPRKTRVPRFLGLSWNRATPFLLARTACGRMPAPETRTVAPGTARREMFRATTVSVVLRPRRARPWTVRTSCFPSAIGCPGVASPTFRPSSTPATRQ